MHKNWIGTTVVAVCIGFSGCGGDDSGGAGGGTGATPIPLDSIPGMFASTFCGLVESCMGEAYSVLTGGLDCETQISRDFEDGDFQNIKSGVKAGTVIYHGEKTQACLDAIAAAGCSQLVSRMPAVCEEAIEGTVVAGGNCAFNAECTGQNYCRVVAQCPGTCTEPGAADAACESDDACQSGLLCDTIQSKCYKPGTGGAACGASEPGCEPTLVCAGASSTEPGTCKTLDSYLSAGEGESCNPAAGGPLCSLELACIVADLDTSTNPPSATWECAKTVASGADCSLGVPDPCPDDEYCDAPFAQGTIQGKCKALPTDGQPCYQAFTGNKLCAPYHVCDASSVCQEVQRLGGACATDSECYSKNCKSGVCDVKTDCPE